MLNANKFSAPMAFQSFSGKAGLNCFLDPFHDFIKRFGLRVAARQIWNISNVIAILIFSTKRRIS